jgi:hypothetical protein
MLASSPAQRLVIPIDGKLLCEPTAPSTTSWSPSPASGGGSGASTPAQTSPIDGGGGPRSGGGGGDVLAVLDALLLDPTETVILKATRPTTVYVASFER